MEKRDLAFTRIFNAPAELVWKVWVDPEIIMQWWGPNMFTCPSAIVDLREGGTSIVCMRAPKEFGGQDTYSTWLYTKIIHLERIEYLHNLADKDGNKLNPTAIGMPAEFPQDQLNVITFKSLDGRRTELTVTQYGWPVIPMIKMAQMGMEQSLGKMEKALANL